MTPLSTARRVLLVPAERSEPVAGQPVLRRYRVARLPLDTPQASSPKRFEYLKRTFD